MLPVELKFTVPWGHISAMAWGSPSSKPVLMVHGSLDNAGSFTRLVAHLPEDCYYVSIDLPSHGLSSHFTPGVFLDYFNFVVAIHYVLEALAWDKCLYIGHSFGAQLGVLYSVFHPGRLEKIVALDALFSKTYTPEDGFHRTKHIFQDILKSSEKGESPLYTKEKIMETLQTGRQFELTKEAAEAIFVRATTQVGDKYRYNRDVRMRVIVTLFFNLEQNLAYMDNLSCPVLLVVAEDSWYDLCSEHEALERIRTTLSRWVTVVNVPGNHDVHNNNPEVIAPLVISFLGQQKSKL